MLDFVEEMNILLERYQSNNSVLQVKSFMVFGFFALILETSFHNTNSLLNYHDGTNIFFNEMKICQSTWLRMVRTLWHISDDFFELFTNSVISNFSSYYCPHKNIAIDESVRRFKG